MIRAVIAHRPAFAASFGSRTGWPTTQQAHRLVGARHLENAECLAVPSAGAAIGVVNINVFLCQLFAEVGQGPGMVAQLDDDNIVFGVARPQIPEHLHGLGQIAGDKPTLELKLSQQSAGGRVPLDVVGS